MTTQEPILVRGGLSGRVYVVTKYRTLSGGRVEALIKFDVTDQFNDLR